MTKSKGQHLDEKLDSRDDSTGQERHAAAGDKSKKKKKRKRKSKKNKRKEDATNESSSLPVTKKIKVADEREDESSSDLPPDSLSDVPLEGSMIGDTMILINRKEGKVYSALERLENGNLKEIGILSKKDGSVVLHKSENNDDHDAQSDDNERTVADFPFPTDADDHCESPVQAYSDIVLFLKDAATKTSKEKLLIYDPYFCNGTVVKNLKSLGFPNVYNRKEDCYQVWNTSHYPLHDVLVTNPPYSGDHIERLINHVTSKDFGNRPWMLLLPQWVHKKDYYIAKTKHIRPFYIVPHKRYVYIPPPSFRESKKSDVHKKSSPFVSMWFIWGGTEKQNDRWLSTIARRITTCDVARSKSALRDLRRKKG